MVLHFDAYDIWHAEHVPFDCRTYGFIHFVHADYDVHCKQNELQLKHWSEPDTEDA